jgi:signal transduction histidine kinase/pSer/pThr/pTyr-binding forkhead associated (FHA) protein
LHRTLLWVAAALAASEIQFFAGSAEIFGRRLIAEGALLPTLHVLQGPDKGRTYSTPNEPALIGRTSDQIQLSDNSASRRHAEIRPSNGSWVLVDLNSSNGTYLNGQRVLSPSPLKHGDQIKVGSTLMVFSGKEQVSGFSGPQMIRDLVDFDMSATPGGSSILSAVDASEDSVILQPPEAADAVAAWNVVYKIAETIGTLETVEAFLERLADLVFDHIIADRLVILTCNEGEEDPTPQVIRHRGRDRDRSRRPKIVTSRTIVKHVCEKKDGVICANAMNDDRFTADSKQDSIHLLGLRSIICVPIIARDQVHGVLHLDSSMSHHTYTHEQLRLAVAIGRLAGMAIENMRLLESRVKTERLAAAGEAVAYLSHYIRNILQGMQGGADVVEMSIKRKSMESVTSGWAMVRRNLDRIYLLALNMLTFSKDRQPKIETVQINRIIEDVIALAQHKADERRVMLLTELDEMPPIPIDPDGMHQVIHNMVLNAIDAMHDTGGRVNISTKYQSSPPQAFVTVSDTGPGIPDEHIGKIFEAFHSSKGHGGTGLGLAAAKKIVSELNGQIRVESKVGEGTSFQIILPAEHVRLADSDRTFHG